MRKIILGLLAVSALAITACTNNDNTDDTNPNLTVVGTWKLTAWNIAQGYDFNQDGTVSNNVLDEVDCLNNETIVFNADGTATSNSTSYLDIEIDLVTGTTNEYEFYIDCGEDIDSYALTYTQNGNVVMVNDQGDILNGVVDGDNLSFTIDDGVEVYSDSTFEVVATQDLILVYTRQ